MNATKITLTESIFRNLLRPEFKITKITSAGAEFTENNLSKAFTRVSLNHSIWLINL